MRLSINGRKRLWSRAEKSLFLAPLLIALAAGAGALWRRQSTTSIEVADVLEFQSLSFSPDGKRLASFGWDARKGLGPSQVYHQVGQVFDVETGVQIAELQSPPVPVSRLRFPVAPPAFTPAPITRPPVVRPIEYGSPCWSPDGKSIVTGYRDFTLGTTRKPGTANAFITPEIAHAVYNQISKFAIWDSTTGKLQGKYLHAPLKEESYGYVAFSKDGKRLVSSGLPLAFYDAATGAQLRTIRGTFQVPGWGTFNEDLKLCAITSKGYGQLEVVEVETGKVLLKTPLSASYGGVYWNGEILTMMGDKGVTFWNAKTRSVLPALPSVPRESSFSPDGRTLALINPHPDPVKDQFPRRFRELVLWDFKNQKELWRYNGESNLYGLQWSPDGEHFSVTSSTSSSSPRDLIVFDIAGNKKFWEGINAGPTQWSPDSRRIAYATGRRIAYGTSKTSEFARIEFIRVK